MSFFTWLLAIIKAIPAIESLVQQFIAFYVQERASYFQKENAAAIRKAIDEHDQRDIEKALGNPKAGKPSGDDGAVIVDDPNGLYK